MCTSNNWKFRSTVLFAILLALLGLWSCSEDNNPVVPDGDGDDVSDGDAVVCNTDDDCPSDHQCEQNVCVPDRDNFCAVNPDAECSQDAECEEGMVCNLDTCMCIEPSDGDGTDGDIPDGDDVVRDCEKLPCIRLDPPFIQFGALKLGETGYSTLIVANEGGAPLQIISMEFSTDTDPDYSWFEVPSVPFTLQPGKQTSFDIVLQPSGPNIDRGKIEIVCNDLFANNGSPTVSMESQYKGTTEIECVPENYDFGPVEVGNRIPLQITCYNHLPEGQLIEETNKLLSLGPMDILSDGQLNFELDENLPDLVYIPPEGTFQFKVYFQPDAAGIHDVTLSIMHDADKSRQSERTEPPHDPWEIELKGVGVVPCLTIDPSPVDFGQVTLGFPMSLPIKLRSTCGGTIRMCGLDWRQPLEPAFTLIDDSDAGHSTIPPNSSKTFWIEFLPTQAKYYGAVLNVCSNDIAQPNLPLPVSGYGIQSSMNIDPSVLHFGDVLLEEGLDKTVTIYNNGSGPLTITAVNAENYVPPPITPIPATPFTVDLEGQSLPYAIQGGEQMSFTVRYEPLSQYIPPNPNDIWQDFANLVIYTDNPSSPSRSIDMDGTPVWPQCEFEWVNNPGFNNVIQFGEVNLGSTLTEKLRVLNFGRADCVAEDIRFGANSSVEFSAIPMLLPPIPHGGYQDIHISYSPAFYTGPDNGSLQIATNDFRESQRNYEVLLEGTGVNPTIFITPETTESAPYDFGDILKTCCSDPVLITIKNHDVGILEIYEDETQLFGITGSWEMSDWFPTPPLGQWKLRQFSQYNGDYINFEVIFCPQGFEDIPQTLRIDIHSNNVLNPITPIFFTGKGVNCPEGWYDIDNDGCECEYYCVRNPDPDKTDLPWEICDGYDNDCDGQIDEDFDLGTTCDGLGACGIGITECAGDQAIRCSTERNGTEDETETEKCDGLDNDCDGFFDEDYEIGSQCAGLGECRLGEWICDENDPFTRLCDVSDQITPEICDGKDNDCDGAVDNSPYFIVNISNPPPTCDDCLGVICQGQGECDVGFYECLNPSAWPEIENPEMWIQCSTDPGGSSTSQFVEICDGKDNDCDGNTDEGYLVGTPCDGVGECGEGVTTCDPDYFLGTICSTDRGGSDFGGTIEICDGKDNDCDGETDNTFDIGGICEGIGECGEGHFECKADHTGRQCSTDRGGTQFSGVWEEILCDGKDDDCDGETDENFHINEPCPGNGSCGIGYMECNGLYDTICSTDFGGSQYGGALEVCDGYDNDCDSQTDEDYLVGQPCTNHGVCGTSTIICLNRDEGCCKGDLGCGEWKGTDEICDGLDNDCDGKTDEDWEVDDPCTFPFGICGIVTGHWECDGTRDRICSTAPGGSQDQSTEEVCNGIDDDCDGVIDNGFDLFSDDIYNCGQCNKVCTVTTDGTTTGVPECDQGTCKIKSCFANYADVDSDYENGCECTIDSHDQGGYGNECSDAKQLSPISIDDITGATPRTITGNLASSTLGAGDVDWFAFRATDATDAPVSQGIRHEQFNVRVSVSPEDEFALEINLGCGVACNDLYPEMECGPGCSTFQWENDGYYDIPTSEENRHPDGFEHCRGYYRCVEADPNDPNNPNNPLQGYNICADFTQMVYIKVYRKDGISPTCRSYSLKVSNGYYQSTNTCSP